MLHTSDSSTLWVLMGSAIRMAQSQGLHRDGGALGLPPFESEMRRRLWWYLVTLDGRLTELMGSESSLPRSMDTLLPSNVNDTDIGPDMTTRPPERIGASEMTFCLLQYEVARFLQEHDPRLDRSEPRVSYRTGKIEKRSVSDLESFLEEKFLRFCDPVMPVQFLTTTMARSFLCKLKQMEHRKKSRPNPNDAHTPTAEQSNGILSIATRNIEYDNLIHSTRKLHGFLWHVNFYFPWGAPIFILKNLSSRSAEWDEDMQEAWTQIEELHEHHPEYINTDKVIHLIVGGLTLKAWAAREAVLESRGVYKQRTPPLIAALQARQAAFLSRHNNDTSRTGIPRPSGANEEMNFVDLNGFDTITAANLELVDPTFAGIDWSSWGGY